MVVAAAIFGSQRSGKIIEFRVDNMAVVHAVNATFCSDGHLMHLIRLLVFSASYHNFWFNASHIERWVSTLADALSRNNLHSFFSQGSPALCLVPKIFSSVADVIQWMMFNDGL